VQLEYEEGDDRLPCYCGAANCKKWMNAEEPKDEEESE
jgi:hypothetical protein